MEQQSLMYPPELTREVLDFLLRALSCELFSTATACSVVEQWVRGNAPASSSHEFIAQYIHGLDMVETKPGFVAHIAHGARGRPCFDEAEIARRIEDQFRRLWSELRTDTTLVENPTGTPSLQGDSLDPVVPRLDEPPMLTAGVLDFLLRALGCGLIPWETACAAVDPWVRGDAPATTRNQIIAQAILRLDLVGTEPARVEYTTDDAVGAPPGTDAPARRSIEEVFEWLWPAAVE